LKSNQVKIKEKEKKEEKERKIFMLHS